MSQDSFEQLLLSELQEMKGDIKAIRLEDVPKMKENIAGFEGKLETLQKQTSWSMKLYTVLGGAIAVGIAKFTGHK